MSSEAFELIVTLPGTAEWCERSAAWLRDMNRGMAAEGNPGLNVAPTVAVNHEADYSELVLSFVAVPGATPWEAIDRGRRVLDAFGLENLTAVRVAAFPQGAGRNA